MVGDSARGGLSVEEFKRRQGQHRDAEIAAMYDVRSFINKTRETYGYPNFVNDSGGSLCELEEPDVIRQLAEDTLIIYLRPSEELLDQIIERSLQNPKPMYYQEAFLDKVLPQYLSEQGLETPDQIDPSDYFRWIFPRLVEHRLPLYESIARDYGVVVQADQIDAIQGEEEFLDLVSDSLT